MTDDNRSFDENAWASDEATDLEGLTTDRVPPASLRRRTIDALQDRGLVRSRRSITPRMIAALAAAASVVFAAGAFAGYAAAVRRVAPHIAEPVALTNAVAVRVDTIVVPSPATKQVVWY